MALFADSARQDSGGMSRRGTVGWSILILALVCGLILGVTPTPYVIQQPGPVYDTLGTAENADGDEVALITISGETVYPTEGQLDLLTVSVVGNPEVRPNWLEVIGAWFDESKAVLPLDAVFQTGVTSEQRNEENQALMINSQHDATAAALTEQGIDYPRHVQITQLLEDSAASGILEPDDLVLSVNGETVGSIQELRAALADNGADKPASLGILRGDTEQTVEVTPTLSGEAVVIGVGVTMDYDFPFEVSLQLDNVGGPSAGMMFALGIIDKLTPGALNGGEHVAGTGTIDPDGNVGPIGGIVQKLHGAKDAGAGWFLAPAANCDEVVGHVPANLEVFSVATLEDSLNVLNTISSDGDLSELPRCSVE